MIIVVVNRLDKQTFKVSVHSHLIIHYQRSVWLQNHFKRGIRSIYNSLKWAIVMGRSIWWWMSVISLKSCFTYKSIRLHQSCFALQIYLINWDLLSYASYKYHWTLLQCNSNSVITNSILFWTQNEFPNGFALQSFTVNYSVVSNSYYFKLFFVSPESLK